MKKSESQKQRSRLLLVGYEKDGTDDLAMRSTIEKELAAVAKQEDSLSAPIQTTRSHRLQIN